MIGRFRSYDLAGDEPLQAFFRRQQQRIASKQIKPRKRLDPGGAYSLEIRGHKPAQIALESPPEEIEKHAGDVGRRMRSGYFISGS